ncbi:MAG: hypothetical protein ACI9UA_005423 [Pseudoalteromonas tetraodonis]|jgi:hypothetical protein
MNFIICAAVGLISLASTHAAIVSGLVSDFEDGTTQGWAGGANPTNVASGGPDGADDNFLRVGNGGRLATHNTTLSGVIDSAATAIQVDLRRPIADADDIDVRLVLLGPGTSNRWTSTALQVVPEDSAWATYTFSLLEADLSQVQGTASYAEMVADVNRVMFRYDPGTPSPGGSVIGGNLDIDNVRVIPEPQVALLALVSGVMIFARRRKR